MTDEKHAQEFFSHPPVAVMVDTDPHPPSMIPVVEHDETTEELYQELNAYLKKKQKENSTGPNAR